MTDNNYEDISGYEKEIKLLQIQNPKWHYNQILSKFKLQYPERIQGNDQLSVDRPKRFRKYLNIYKLDSNNRLVYVF